MTTENTQSQVRIQSDLSDLITTKKGLRQGDSLACLLLNLALEKVVRNAGIQTSGTIFYKSVQILAHADDIDVIARSRTALQEAFLSLERAAGKTGLGINDKKTKYLTKRESKKSTGLFSN